MVNPAVSGFKAILWRLGTLYGIAALLFLVASGSPVRWVQSFIEPDTKITATKDGLVPDCLRARSDALHCAETPMRYRLKRVPLLDAQAKPCPTGTYPGSWQECLPCEKLGKNPRWDSTGYQAHSLASSDIVMGAYTPDGEPMIVTGGNENVNDSTACAQLSSATVAE